MALADVNDGGTPYMGISPRRTRPCTHRPEREQELEREREQELERERERAHQRTSFGCTCTASVFLVVRER